MAFHFCSHSWEVRDVEDGTLVKLTPRDLDKESVPVIVDELFDLARESGRPNIYLDFSNIQVLASVVLGKLVALDAKLREHGGRLILLQLDRHLHGVCQATRLTEVLDIRAGDLAESMA